MGYLIKVDFSKRGKDLYDMTKIRRVVTIEDNHYEATSLRNKIHIEKSSKYKQSQYHIAQRYLMKKFKSATIRKYHEGELYVFKKGIAKVPAMFYGRGFDRKQATVTLKEFNSLTK